MTDHDAVAVLAHHVRGLDTDARAALVADLWGARGFETSPEGHEVIATGRGGTLRIGVDGAVTSDDPADIVISTVDERASPGVAADVRVVDAAGLARMLRYTVDRSTAAALCERHLGAPPEELRPPTRNRLRARLRGLRAATVGPIDAAEAPVAPASFLGVVLVLLVVGAAAGVALTGTSGTPSASVDGNVDPVSVPESTPVGGAVVEPSTPVRAATTTAGAGSRNASVVPGLTEDGIADLSALAAAHARSLLGGSYTLWMDTYRPPTGEPDGARTQYDTDVAVASERFLVRENVGDDDRRRLRTLFHDGEDWYVANESNGTYERIARREQTPPSSPNPDSIALGLVANYLSTPETDVEGPVAGGSGRGTDGPTRYRLVGRGTPPTMDADAVRNYTAVALVGRDGLVRDLEVTYTRVTGTGRYRVRKEWTYGYLGETTVTPPAWYVERFVGNGTAPSETPDG